MPRLALALALCACAAGSREAYRSQLCTPAAAREEGARDAEAGKPAAAAAFAEPCVAALRPRLLDAYRTGYVEAGARTGKAAVPGARAFRCEVSPFGEPFVGFGATDREARAAALAACAAKHGERGCAVDVRCGVGE